MPRPHQHSPRPKPFKPCNQPSHKECPNEIHIQNYCNLGAAFTVGGVGSGTYTSGITTTGTTGQTCALTAFNGTAGTGAAATVALTGTNTIAGGTALVITNTGVGYTAVSTSATAGNGTATCSGTAAITTVLGGQQGNAIMLMSVQ